MNTEHFLGEKEIQEIESIVGYSFTDKELLRQCFTLSSVSEKNNERLEFLGDSVVQFFVSDFLYKRLNIDEGSMTEIRKKFVANDVLRSAVEKLGLDKYICYAGTKANLGKKPVASLFEALAAGVYLDGGIVEVKNFILEKLIKPKEEQLLQNKNSQSGNFKSILQEYLQARGIPLAEYVLLEKKGPDHCPVFSVAVQAKGYTATGEGLGKNAAEQAAAKKLLEMLRNG